MTDGFTLHLLAVPPTLMLGLLATLDALHREVQLTALDLPGPSPLGPRAHDALVDGRTRVESARNAILDQAVAAREAGEELVDIAADYVAADVAPFRSARGGVAAADAAAAQGELLASPMDPEERRLWLWVGVEFEGQAAGADPTPFPPKAG